MSDKNEQLLEFLGFDKEIEDVDAAKAKFAEKFVAIQTLGDRKDLIDPLFSKTKDIFETKAKSTFKKLGVEWGDGATKGKSGVEILDMGRDMLTANHKTVVDDLKGQIGQSNDEALGALQGKYDTLTTDYGTLETTHKTLASDFTEFKSTSDATAKAKDLDRAVSALWSGVKYSDKADDLQKRGFKSSVTEEFKFALVEGSYDELEVRVAKTGEKIPSTKDATVFVSPAELITSKAIEHKLHNIAPERQGNTQQQAAQQEQAAQQNSSAPTRHRNERSNTATA